MLQYNGWLYVSKDPVYVPWPVLQISPASDLYQLMYRSGVYRSFSTSIRDTQHRLKGCGVGGHSEKEFTRSIRSDLLSSLVPSVLSFVLKKNVLSLSGSACRGLGLGWRMRSNNKYPFRLINHRFNLIVYSSKSNPGVIITILLMSLVMQCISLCLQLTYLIRVHPRWGWVCHFNPFKGCVSINALAK